MKKGYLSNLETWSINEDEQKVPILLNKSKRDHRCFIKLFNKYLDKSSNFQEEVFEIGCSPGKFLIYLASNLGYQPSGVEIDKGRCELTRRNLKSQNLKAHIIQEDIFKINLKKKFKVIISCGFIEHFEGKKLEELLKIHSDLIKKDGVIFLSFPNFRYLNFLFAYFFRKDVLDQHNLKIMNKDFFKYFAEKYGFKILYLDYFGSIHPGGFKFSDKSFFSFINNFLIRFEKIEFLDNVNSKYFSHHLGAVLKKI